MNGTLGELLTEKASANTDKPYLYFQDQQISYAHLEAQANRYGHAFRDLGLAKGDHAALLLPNSPEYLYCWFGLAKIGAVTVTLNHQFGGESLGSIIQESNSKLLIVAPVLLEKALGAKDRLKRITCAILGRSAEVSDELVDLGALVPETPAASGLDLPVKDIDPLIITFTSGTTGLPKLVRNSHRAYLRGALDLAAAVEIRPGDRIYTHLPLFHANPQVYCILTALVADAAVVLAPRFSASGFWSDIRKHRATAFSYVGAVLPILLAQPETEADSDHTAVKCFGGGAPKEVYDRFSRRFGVEVLELYGMSETGAWNTINRPGRGRSGSVGTIREGFEIRIVDEEDNELPVGRIGEFVIRPLKPFIMFDGYYNNPEETLRCSRNWWFHTGDLGKVDEEGYYYFCGRKKESIRRAGENLPPGEIEKVVDGHPMVLESAAVGIADPILEEEIKVAVVPRPGCAPDPAELRSWCEGRLPRFMVPRYIEIVDRLPKSPSEKIQRTAIKERGITERTWDSKKP
jgi:crotonobetaine/carnitine-CoA ligase